MQRPVPGHSSIFSENFAKYHDDAPSTATHDPNVYNPCTTTVDLNNYENMYHLPSPEDPCTTTDVVYDYFPRQHLNNYFHYEMYHYRRPVNDYFLYETRTAPKTHASKV